MRRPLIVVCLLGLLVPACSSTETSTTVTSAAVAGSPAPPTTAGAPLVEAPSTTTSGPLVPATTVPVGVAASTAPLVPFVVCTSSATPLGPQTSPTTTVVVVGAGGAAPSSAAPAAFTLPWDSEVVFGYTNEAARAVVVPSGDRNSLVGAAADDDPLVPVAFPPGRVDRAFVAYVGRAGAAPEWRVTGPDGVTRTAAPSAVSPPCDAAQLGEGEAAESPLLTYAYRAVPGPDGKPAAAEVRVVLSGLPALSVCATGLVARPPVAVLLVNGQQRSSGEAITVARGAATFTYVRTEAHVADVCEADGVRSASWTAGAAYDTLRRGSTVCLRFEDGGVSLVVPGQVTGCDVLAATGGIKTRRVAIAP